MMSDSLARVRDEAIRWVIATSDRDFDQWDEFSRWLAADPGHLAGYEAALDRDYVVYNALSQPGVGDAGLGRRRSSRRRWWFGGAAAVAACLAIALIPRASVVPPEPRVIQTGDGQRLHVALDDGSAIWLNGGTRLILANRNRQVTFERGEALFQVIHDPAHPFTVVAGQRSVTDVGTVFNFARNGDVLDVGVVDGEVSFEAEGHSLALRRGIALHVDHNGRATLAEAPPDHIASWRAGRLFFSDTTLDNVAAALTRNVGDRIRVDGPARQIRFTGTITLTDTPDAAIRSAAALAGVKATRESGGWRWSE